MRLSALALFASLALAAVAVAEPTTKPWLGLHVLIGGSADLDKTAKSIPALGKLGVNAIIVEIGYNFRFTSRPEMAANGGITREQAQAFSALCRANGIRPIPGLNCLGHQSWAKNNGSLLRHHPELDETPNKYPNNEGIYCRSWCPLHPQLDSIVLPMIDELIDAFSADAFHVGMDEVFIMADADCPRCHGKDPAELFAHQVNDLHAHLVDQKKVEMLMWADRFLDAKALGYSKWEASTNGTFGAVDKVPTDIVLCDWHYLAKPEYKSLPFLAGKGFRVWPAGYDKEEATERLLSASLGLKDAHIIGYLSTTWGKAKLDHLEEYPPTKLAIEKWSKP
jgi:hypothetical protein